ncbi:VOC family protein [Streptomyces sp. NPDC088090]|uniref:VOC family protein n=1 Tax=Streptomyces sp. NPDC088090 TaxID=3365822 RepID=UPI00384C401C
MDHFAFTVADLDAAVQFFAEVLGGELCYVEGPVQDPAGDWMRRKLGVHPRAVAHVAMVRLGPYTNLELFRYTAPGQRTGPVPLDAPGGRRMALWVARVEAAVARLRERADVTVTRDTVRPTLRPGYPTRQVDLVTSWGLELRLTGSPAALEGGAPDPAEAPGEVLAADHLALTVTDLDASVRFFTEVVGATPLAPHAPRAQAGHPARARLRLGPTDRIELRQYEGDGTPQAPANSDVGGSHLAFHVDDVDTAAAWLATRPGVGVMGEPETITDGPIAGNRWVYFTTPIGIQMEILHMPDGTGLLPYERRTEARRASSHPFTWA